MKALIFDSGTLINLSMTGLLNILPGLKKMFGGRLLITRAVKQEVIDRPIGVMRFELGALRIKKLLEDGVIEMPSSLGISDEKIQVVSKELMDMANHYLQVRGNWVHLVSEAEISCLALSDELAKLDIANLIAIDERTTRVLCENPRSLENIMQGKLHQKVSLVMDDMSIFSKYKFIRSSELVFVAYKKGLIDLKGDKVLEALLYATKFNGSSISFEEINILKKI
ncbi:MAG: hypothetical protein Q8Q31_05915 [Nanoarchaeota archaeon]|nr:hypothetical protein [Nanoarchaeota archaeon]